MTSFKIVFSAIVFGAALALPVGAATPNPALTPILANTTYDMGFWWRAK